jgi:PST family polysaccharide transporter
MSVGMGAGYASRRIDNAIVSGLFGADVAGAYNLAYNVADAPAVQVGEQIGDVLLPSFSRMDGRERRVALLRSTALLALVTFPMAVGLGTVAPTLVAALLRPEWQDVGPMLGLLSVLSVVRPVGWTISSYLLARDQPRLDAAIEVVKLGSLVMLLLTLGRWGPLWACAAVGLAFAIHACVSMVAVQVLDGISVAALARECAPPLMACAPMVVAVLSSRLALAHVGVRRGPATLAIEVAIGTVAYVISALAIARSASTDLLAVVGRVRRDRLAAEARHAE